MWLPLVGEVSSSVPLVSIVLPVLNGARHISSAIENCLAQSYSHIELIIVDGGSVDDTLCICRGVLDQRIRIIEQSDNGGRLPGALNLGVRVAKGKYLTWTHDDNLFDRQAISRMVAALEACSEARLVYADYVLMTSDMRTIRRVGVGQVEDLVERNCIGPCFLYWRNVHECVGDYNEAAFLQEDYEFWLRVTAVFSAISLSDPLYYYRVHSESLTGRYRQAMFDQFVRIRRIHFADRPLPSRRLSLARWYMAWAFEDYFAGQYEIALRGAVQAIVRHPAYLADRGVLVVLVRSFCLLAMRSGAR